MSWEAYGFSFSKRHMFHWSHRNQKTRNGVYRKEAVRAVLMSQWETKDCTESWGVKGKPILEEKCKKIFFENGHIRNRWEQSSTAESQKTHLLGPKNPRDCRWSQVRICSCTSSQLKQIIFNGIFSFHREVSSRFWSARPFERKRLS